jgi:RNA polymerase sigma-70 factor (ECF subfamily)
MFSDEQRISFTSPERGQWFVTTHWSVVLAAGQTASSAASDALEKLCRTYWAPLYSYVRRRGRSPHDAQDLTQEFFARLLQKNYLGDVEPQKGKFRSFLRGALNNFLANEYDRATTLKRGGGKEIIPLDEASAETQYSLETSELSPEKAFEKRWAIALLERAFTRTREEFAAAGKAAQFEKLRGFLSDKADQGGYGSLALELGMTPNRVAVTVHRLRERYCEIVREEVAHTVSSADQIEEEMRHLFAILAQ